MNEKIEELYAEAKQATKIGRMNAPSGVVAKKFAELIVKECAGLVDHVIMEDGTRRSDFIRKHSGVDL